MALHRAHNIVSSCQALRAFRSPSRPASRSRFLASTHYTHYDPWLFAVNLSALVFVLIPKLPIVSLRFRQCAALRHAARPY